MGGENALRRHHTVHPWAPSDRDYGKQQGHRTKQGDLQNEKAAPPLDIFLSVRGVVMENNAATTAEVGVHCTFSGGLSKNSTAAAGRNTTPTRSARESHLQDNCRRAVVGQVGDCRNRRAKDDPVLLQLVFVLVPMKGHPKV